MRKQNDDFLPLSSTAQSFYTCPSRGRYSYLEVNQEHSKIGNSKRQSKCDRVVTETKNTPDLSSFQGNSKYQTQGRIKVSRSQYESQSQTSQNSHEQRKQYPGNFRQEQKVVQVMDKKYYFKSPVKYKFDDRKIQHLFGYSNDNGKVSAQTNSHPNYVDKRLYQQGINYEQKPVQIINYNYYFASTNDDEVKSKRSSKCQIKNQVINQIMLKSKEKNKRQSLVTKNRNRKSMPTEMEQCFLPEIKQCLLPKMQQHFLPGIEECFLPEIEQFIIPETKQYFLAETKQYYMPETKQYSLEPSPDTLKNRDKIIDNQRGILYVDNTNIDTGNSIDKIGTNLKNQPNEQAHQSGEVDFITQRSISSNLNSHVDSLQVIASDQTSNILVQKFERQNQQSYEVQRQEKKSQKLERQKSQLQKFERQNIQLQKQNSKLQTIISQKVQRQKQLLLKLNRLMKVIGGAKEEYIDKLSQEQLLNSDSAFWNKEQQLQDYLLDVTNQHYNNISTRQSQNNLQSHKFLRNALNFATQETQNCDQSSQQEQQQQYCYSNLNLDSCLLDNSNQTDLLRSQTMRNNVDMKKKTLGDCRSKNTSIVLDSEDINNLNNEWKEPQESGVPTKNQHNVLFRNIVSNNQGLGIRLGNRKQTRKSTKFVTDTILQYSLVDQSSLTPVKPTSQKGNIYENQLQSNNFLSYNSMSNNNILISSNSGIDLSISGFDSRFVPRQTNEQKLLELEDMFQAELKKCFSSSSIDKQELNSQKDIQAIQQLTQNYQDECTMTKDQTNNNNVIYNKDRKGIINTSKNFTRKEQMRQNGTKRSQSKQKLKTLTIKIKSLRQIISKGDHQQKEH